MIVFADWPPVSINIRALGGVASSDQYGGHVDSLLQWNSSEQCGIYVYTLPPHSNIYLNALFYHWAIVRERSG